MKDFEHELREVLRRQQPPVGFAERVLRRLPNQPSQRRVQWPRRAIVWAAAAAVVVAVGGGLQYHAVQQARQERARGEAAKEQVLDALRLAGSKLQLVRAKIKETGS